MGYLSVGSSNTFYYLFRLQDETIYLLTMGRSRPTLSLSTDTEIRQRMNPQARH